MVKTYHEAPISIMQEVSNATYGDYALVHLLEQEPDYLKFFKEKANHVILDNSVFELGTAFDPERFAYWVRELKPEFYIVPDVLEDAQGTVTSFFNFTRGPGRDLPGGRIGVVQGKNYEELVWCYSQIKDFCDKVAFSFDYSWYEKEFPVDSEPELYPHSPLQMCIPTKWHSWACGRTALLQRMFNDRVLDFRKAHHLLGVGLPQEMQFYTAMQNDPMVGHLWSCIESVDTSNPVVHGLKGIRYTCTGLEFKESQKLHELINADVDLFQREDIMHNIKVFGGFCNVK